MNILVIDGQGGKLGCQMVKSIAEKYPGARLMAVGTNSAAAAAMAKAGAHQAVIADSLFGEITPAMAVAVAQSDAVRILLPVNRCGNIVAGVQELSLTALISDAMAKLEGVMQE